MEHQLTVRKEEAGERLDKWLCAKFPTLSRKRIKELLDGGRVLVNSRRVVIAGWEVEPGDNVEVRIPLIFERTEGTREEPLPHPLPPRKEGIGGDAGHQGIRASIERHFERLKEKRVPPPQGETKGIGRPERHARLRVYHEDKDTIVVEKPAGMLAVPSEGKGQGGKNLLVEIKAYLKRRHRRTKGSFVMPLHRLDAETSGIMIFALSNTGSKLLQQFRDHSVSREYLAVVTGRLEDGHGVIDIPLEKGDFHGGRKVRPAPHGGGRRAVTEFRVRERYANATFLDVKVRTGRTHQIRVHLAERGFPIIGDKLYSKLAKSALDFHRHALHASMIGFNHPATGKKYTFHSPLPQDIRDLIDRFRQSQ